MESSLQIIKSFATARAHIKRRSEKAMNVLFSGKRNLNLFFDLQLKLFNNAILHILTYSCAVLSYEDYFKKNIKKYASFFFRKITGARKQKSTPLFLLYSEIGR